MSASRVASNVSATMTAPIPPSSHRFHRPVVEMTRPLVMEETSRPPTSAIDIRPARVGLIPRAFWKYSLR